MIQLRLLGGARLERDGEVVTGRAGQRHPMALLALLATAPTGSLTRDRLLSHLWSDDHAKAARHRLSVALHVVRKQLGKEAVRSHGDALALDPSVVRVDVRDYRDAIDSGDLTTAVSLYRGPFLDGFFLPGVHTFDRWMEAERERLTRVQEGALEQLAREASAREDPGRAAVLWRRLGTLRPMSDRVARLVAEGLEEAGDRTGALAHLRRHATRLTAELGAEPDPDLRALAERLAATPVTPREAVPSAPPPDAVPYAQEEPDASSRPSDPIRPSPPHRHRLLRNLVAVAALVLVMGALILGTVADPPAAPTTLRMDPTALADGSPDGAPIARGLAAEVRGLLTVLPGVEPLDDGRLSGARNRGGHTLRTAVHLDGDMAVMEASLLRIPDTRPVWAGRLQAHTGKPERVRDDLALALALELRRYLASDGPPASTASREARDRYLEGLWNHRRWGRANTWKALQLYGEALALDSTFALARAMRADAYLGLARTDDDPRASVEQARKELRRAMELDPSLPVAHRILGSLRFWYDWDFPAAARSYRRAIVLDPDDAVARASYAGYLLRVASRPDAALRQLRTALELDPLNAARSHGIERTLYFAGRYEEVLRQAQVTRSLRSDLAWKPGAPEANALRELGRYEEAATAYREAQRWGGGPVHTGLGIVYARTGRPEQALAVARAYEGARPGRHHLPVAAVYAALGDHDEALALLEEAHRRRHTSVLHLAVDPGLDPLRGNPRFQELLRQLGLPGGGGDKVVQLEVGPKPLRHRRNSCSVQGGRCGTSPASAIAR